MEVFGHFVFPRFSGFFRAFPFVYRLFRAFLFTILFRHFVLPPIIFCMIEIRMKFSLWRLMTFKILSKIKSSVNTGTALKVL